MARKRAYRPGQIGCETCDSHGAGGGNNLPPTKESESQSVMKFGEMARAAGKTIKTGGLALALAAAMQPVAVSAQAAAPAAPVAAAPAPAPIASTAAVATANKGAAPTGGYVPMKPTEGVGQPVAGALNTQAQFSPTGEYANWMHYILLWIITIITIFVLGLLIYVMLRFNKRANPVPSKTSHNTMIEVVWTLIPVLILVGIAIPSITLLGKQFTPPPKNALTIKATGYQWYWTYTYPDNGGFEIVSNMLPHEEAIKRGEPSQLAADYRMVVPVGEKIRLQVTGADVIHSFAVPSLWFKLDAVPGRMNEKVLEVTKPGVYYGQCSELCGARHGYMPIAVEALPRDKYNAWVLSQAGGKIDGQPEPAAAAPAAAAPAVAVPAAGAASTVISVGAPSTGGKTTVTTVPADKAPSSPAPAV